MLVKIHKTYRWVVAVCDSNLIGKKFEEGNKQLDLTGDFFKGDEKESEEIKGILADCQREDATFFIVGKESVGLCQEMGLVGGGVGSGSGDRVVGDVGGGVGAGDGAGGGVGSVGGVPVALVLL
ncbi:hypothetical protein CMI41_00055 [Candidatus Pacearchaeota archaeon]|nr:hypothetical protein [Candidatus Pacearchaeota archaeon]